MILQHFLSASLLPSLPDLFFREALCVTLLTLALATFATTAISVQTIKIIETIKVAQVCKVVEIQIPGEIARDGG